MDNVYIVEDDLVLANNLKTIISELGFRVIGSAADAQTAYSEINEHKPSYILMDINLPGEENGVQLAKRLYDKLNTGIIYITGNVSRSIFEEATESNILSFIRKPFKMEDIKNSLIIAKSKKDQQEREKLFDQELSRKARLLQAGELVSKLTHELNNYNLIFTHKFNKIIQTIAKKEEGYEDKVVEVAQSGLESVDKLIDLSRNYRKIILDCENEQFQTVNLHQFIDHIHKFLEFKFGEVKFINECPKDINIQLRPTQAFQAFVNLIDNSVQAINHLKDKWVKVSYRDDENHHIIRFTDSGGGVSGSAAHLFDLFYTTKGAKGTGIGLNLVRHTAKFHYGEVKYLPDEKNTTFEFSIGKQSVA